MREGWQTVAISDVAEVVNGGTPKSKVAEFWGGKNLWITPAEMGNLSTPYLATSRRTLTDVGLNGSSASLVPPHSVILSTRAPIGHLAINLEPMAFNQGCRGIVPGERLHYKYLYYCLLNNVEKLNDLGSGTTFKELAARNLKTFQIPVGPLTEQKRIVAILDEAFAGIDTAIDNTEKNLANAWELFERYRDSIFEDGQKFWDQMKLGDLYHIGSGKRVHKKDWRSSGVPFYRAREIVKLAEHGTVKNELFISKELFEEYRKKTGAPSAGDLMVTAVGTLGICYVVQPSDRFYFKDASVLWFRPNRKVNEDFIKHAFRSNLIRKQTTDSQGATVGTLTISRANSISIAIPSIQTQTVIASDIAAFESEVMALRSVYQKKLDALHELKQCLLEKAFNGEMRSDSSTSVFRQTEFDAVTI